MDIFLPITEVLHTLAFKFENLDIFSLPFQYVIIKDVYSIWYHIVKLAEIEKVNPNITRCNYAFDGLDFNLDDQKKITLVSYLTGIYPYVLPSKFVFLFT